MLGLATGPYCLTACAPMLVPYVLASVEGRRRRGLLTLGEFLTGRFLAYVLFGAAAGFFSGRFSGTLPARGVAAAVFGAGVLMLLYSLPKTFPTVRMCAHMNAFPGLRRLPLALGFLAGINICPPFLAGVARVLESGSAGFGGVYFAAFFAGTSVYLLPLAAALPFTHIKRLQSIGTLACGVAGLWFMGTGVVGLLKG